MDRLFLAVFLACFSLTVMAQVTPVSKLELAPEGSLTPALSQKERGIQGIRCATSTVMAECESIDAIRKTAFVYERGLGVRLDYQQAFKLYCKAALLGDARSAYDLGFIYFNGRGLKSDLSLAMHWMQIAAQGGDLLARRMLAHYRDVAIRDDLNCPFPQVKPMPIESLVYEISASHAIDPRLVMAVIQVESGFNPHAASKKNALGLMQLTLETAERFGVNDVWDARQNIQGGVAYLHWLMQRFSNNIEWVLAAYNAGEAAVERYQGVPPYEETRRYVRQILMRYPASSPS